MPWPNIRSGNQINTVRAFDLSAFYVGRGGGGDSTRLILIYTVPIIGMILGNAISAVGLAVNSVHKEFAENKDRIETYLAMGASRFEACQPVAVEALKMALLPTVNQLR